MDKFAIDLDSILDELEQNDDSNDRARPPSLMKIATSNTFGYGNNFGSISSYCDDSADRSSLQRLTDGIGCSTSATAPSTSVASNQYKRHLLSSYMESQTIEKLDSSEAEFGISIKPIETQTNQNIDLNNGNKSVISTYNSNNDFNQKSEFEKNELITSLLEKAKWNTEDAGREYDIDTTSSEEDISEEVLVVEQIEFKDEVKDSEQTSSINNNTDNLQTIPKEELNRSEDICLTSELRESPDGEADLTLTDLKTNEDQSASLLSDPNRTNESENSETLRADVTDLNDLNEELIEELTKSKPKMESISSEEEKANIVEVSEVEDQKVANEWPNDAIENNFDKTPNVVKFSDIEVNIDDLTEHEINDYLSDLNVSQIETNEAIDGTNESNIATNINTFLQTTCDSPKEDLLNANSDKDLNSMSQSTSSVSIEENDKISDISDFDISHQSQVCLEPNDSSNPVMDDECHNSEVNSQTISDDIPVRIVRPNSLPIASNAVLVNSNETNPELDNTNDENNNDNNNNEGDNNLLNSEDFVANGPSFEFDEQNLTLGLSEDEQMLGKVKPFWIPDSETQMCMHCDIRFTLIKRRHHCRACGKVLCAQCCNSRAKLLYLDNEVARVCQICYSTLARIAAIERNAHSSPLRRDNLSSDSAFGSSEASNFRSPDPNNPSEYCSTVSPLEQSQDLLNRPPLTVMVPVGVLKRAGDRPKGEPKQVVFSDGIRPGGDLTETSESSSSLAFLRRTGRTQLKLKSPPVDGMASTQTSLLPSKSKASRVVITDPNGTLPPIINYYDLNRNKSAKSKPSVTNLIEFMKTKDLCPVVFALTKNLHVYAKIVFKNCCVQSECWTFASKGMATIGQDEILVTLERLPEEEVFPRDVFRLFTFVYDSASKGTAFTDLSHAFFPEGLFGNKDNSGFLFIRPTLQCFSSLVLPSPPFLLAILIHKWEIPWAKVFPLRLLLRLGAEYKYYPSPIVSYRCRKPVYCEIGHTIMNVLADFRNFQYTLPTVPGLTIHLEEKRISVHLPRNRYEKVQKVLTNSNEHVLAFGANFSLKADSHLVCMQNDVDGQYQTQSINIDGAIRKITGASFIVFSGALKSSTGLTAKMSIVEDGLLVQIPPNTMTEMRHSLKDMKNYSISCGKVGSEPEEMIDMLWDEEDTNVNLGVRSPIDGTNLEGIQSIRIYSGTDYTNDKLVIRWTEVFFLQMNQMSRRNDSIDASKLAEMISQAFCLALTSCLDQLFENGLTKIGLRINLDSDKVGYEVGANGQPLPAQFATELDSALIPVIMDSVSHGVEDHLVMELLFHILIK